MELSEENPIFLFSRMLQLFPNVPHDVIQLYTSQYSNDAEMCAKMLGLLSNKFTQVEDIQVQSPSVEKSVDLDSKHNNKIACSEEESDNFNLLTYELGKLHLYYPPVTNHDNSSINGVGSLDCFKMAHSNESSSPQYKPYNGNDILVNEGIVLFAKPTELQVQVSPDNSTVNNNLYGSEHFKNGSCILPMLQGSLPNELHIDIDCDKEFHSWRPNLSLSSLSSDFFLPQPEYASNSDVSEPGFIRNEIEYCKDSKHDMLQNDKRTTYQKEVLNNFEEATAYLLPRNINNFQTDIQGYVNLQKSQMSILIYELMKTERELNETREAVERLTYDRQLQSKNALDIEILNKENAQLRLECQCLCMEVDFFLKGKAPLGEIEENLDKDEKVPSAIRLDNVTSINNQFENSEQDIENGDEDELSKWQCHQCTFANHPAIDACEICQAPRLRSQNCRVLSSGPSTCYCHPKKKSVVPLSS